ncbi:MAG: peroxidase family protein [Planctomycetota bacterium]
MTTSLPFTVLAVSISAAMGSATALAHNTPPSPGQERSPVQRPPQRPSDTSIVPPTMGGPAQFPQEFRTIDGTFNNLQNPLWGSTGTNLLRLMPAAYADGTSAPAAPGRPSPRAISTIIIDQVNDRPNSMNLTDYVWQWGQFLDHDIDETPIADPSEPFDIAVPTGDPWFDPDSTGIVTIPLDRSAYDMVHGLRQQINNITSYIDASNVYGSEIERAEALRTHDGTGRLKTSTNDLLPFNTDALENAPSSLIPTFFVAGDIRANEQVGLTAMHTLFVREHNRLADQIALQQPHLDGDAIYERARAIVGAEMQAITYNEFLPRLLGAHAIPPYQGYRPQVNASIANVFATAAYRVGHTMLSSEILRLDAYGDPINDGHLDLASAFFNPDEISLEGIEPVLRGLAAQRAQNVDNFVVDDVRNFLFGEPGRGGFDLPSLNIQRGRDHGLPSYNNVRMFVGRPPAMTFSQISPDPAVQSRLAAAYAHAGEVDAWVGMLCEPHRPNAFVGETLYRVLRDQFIRLRDGDRFWYESYLPPPLIDEVNALTLAEIIRLNTDIGSEIQDDVFVMAIVCEEDVTKNGVINIDDLLAAINAFGPCDDCPEDVTGNDVVNIDDLLAIINAFGPCVLEPGN